MQAGSETMGFYRDGMVYFKEDIATAVNKYLLQTAMEEVAHYVTGATDMSRDFQNFLIQVIVEIKALTYGVGSPIAETARQGTQRAGASPARRHLEMRGASW